ncbi:hypothetical protein K431DRAFT_294682 [Polychaeton citri CBS 116435]|uniref:Cytidyltransferase-like domain-containing protein n=1 Tax=Polychaeton citri CBS 116435 TaxID=1314669 RepID=A0A9P4UNS1_9PEZI|nr:hypothetical protein K431DRAFT_294682 [Polychaeton citri CBS 116435]
MSLKNYLQMAYREARLTSKADLDTFQHLEGTLRRDHENLILVYGGSFNPPHRGHLDVLLSGLRPEVTAVAIVVLPSEDFHLRHKVANSHPDFFLRMERRADLWSAIPSVPEVKVWIWTSTWYPFKTFNEALIRLTKEDGFKLAFAHMIGPDNVDLRNPLANYPYELPTMLITNKARHVAAHFRPDGKPAIWNGFGEWSRCSRNAGYDDLKSDQPDVVLWTCRGIGDCNAEKRGYYLQFADFASVDINSTNLRGSLLKTHHLDEQRLNQLSIKALLEMLASVL